MGRLRQGWGQEVAHRDELQDPGHCHGPESGHTAGEAETQQGEVSGPGGQEAGPSQMLGSSKVKTGSREGVKAAVLGCPQTVMPPTGVT